MNGITPIKIWEIFISLAMLWITKRFRPKGGVINPSSTTIKIIIPNHIAVSVGLMPKSWLMSIGKKIGIVRRTIDRLSKNNPKIR